MRSISAKPLSPPCSRDNALSTGLLGRRTELTNGGNCSGGDCAGGYCVGGYCVGEMA